jgi:sugar lactone lactonase YvrE
MSQVLIFIRNISWLFLTLIWYTGNVYISDTNNQRIRKVTASTGIITTFAGDADTTYYNDGITATSGTLYRPYGLTTDSAGNVYIAEQSGLRIRKIIIDGSNGIR